MRPTLPTIRARTVVVIVALVAIASVVAGRERGDPAPPAPAAQLSAARSDSSAAASASANRLETVLDLERLKRPQSSEPIPNLFAPPAPPPSAPAAATKAPRGATAPAEPAVPALPFAYLGRMVDGSTTAVFLAQGERNISVEAGQKIDATYQLASIDDNALTLIHLPTGTRQVRQIPPRN
jgi:hypothetical protein